MAPMIPDGLRFGTWCGRPWKKRHVCYTFTFGEINVKQVTMSTQASAGPEQENASALPRPALVKLFDDTRKRLVETGTRNRLVHVNRANTRGNVVNIVNERADAVHAQLYAKKSMRFLAVGKDTGDELNVALADIGEEGFDAARLADNRLETRLGPDALQKKLLAMAREAQTAEEESGVNILYLALGFLTWFEDPASQVAREAPLVLLPVELVRNDRTSTYELRLRDDDAVTNLPLQQRLIDDFGLHLPELDIDDAWTPAAYFAQVGAAVASRTGWRVDGDAIQLGFFSFAKLLMYRDLSVDMWPAGAIADHALTRGLLYEGFGAEAPLFSDATRLDDVLPPSNMFHVLDADASQARVIEEVRAGRNLVVQGPPGTGKSQTITNIIAAAVKDGKRVLFVAEKMAALSVVHDRLVKVGLRDICLELHSRSASKLAVLTELARTLGAGAALPQVPGAPQALTVARDSLNAIAEALHAPIGASGTTAFAVLSRQIHFMGRDVAPPNLDGAALVGLTDAQETVLRGRLMQYGALAATAQAAPFAGVATFDLQPVDLVRLKALAAAAAASLARLATTLAAPVAALEAGVPLTLASSARVQDVLARLPGCPAGSAALAEALLACRDLARVRRVLEAGAAWRAAREGADATFIDAAFAMDVAPLRTPLVAGAASFLARWGGAYRNASEQLAGLLRAPMPKAALDRVALVDRLLAVASLRAQWEGDAQDAAGVLGPAWRAERTDFSALLPVLAWAARVKGADLACPPAALVRLAQDGAQAAAMHQALAQVDSLARRALDEVLDLLAIDAATFAADGGLRALGERCAVIAASTHLYAGWAEAQRLYCGLCANGFTELADRIAAGQPAAAACDEVAYARAEALWQQARAASPVLYGLSQEKRHALVQRFGDLERERLKDNVTTIRAGHLQQLPPGAQGEMKILRGEIGKKRGHMALRRLFSLAGEAVQRIKPVLLMSPISVAQFLPPGKLAFDLLVIDEASQVRPEDALGAVARAQQIVVVGDQKQLPPSSFFDRVLADGADEDTFDDDASPDLLGNAAAAGAMESILSLCEARGLSSRMLQWHYRSRDPSLIAVSNAEFYDHALILPPSPLQKDAAYGLRFTRVDGVYDKGGKRDNRIEGEALVARVAEHARTNPQLSLGIVTFSTSQRNLITELLEFARRTDAVLDGFLREGQQEDVFVKNIENVQGDERDVILISVGYGPAVPGGRLSSMTFGPVNQEGGERRLNVLFTRARVRCEIFASFEPGDIDPERVSRDGARILKRFLEFARDGRMTQTAASIGSADSPFEADVARVVEGMGYLADPQVGSAGFRIDMGIRHPDQADTYILAIECDGATYHSALWARERDRLRQDVLENLGWTFHRIWSTDWFYNRDVEIERLRTALDAARVQGQSGIRVKGANRERPAPVPAPIAEPVTVPAMVAVRMPFYQRALFPMDGGEPQDAPADELADLAWKIVDAEGPIHVEEVARRVAASFGKEKAGARILACTVAALAAAKNAHAGLLCEDDFYYTTAQASAPTVRDRSMETGSTLKAKTIATLEIKAALALARQHNAGGTDADTIKSAAGLLGFRRVGPDLQERIAAVNREVAAAAAEVPVVKGAGTFPVAVALARAVPGHLAAQPSFPCQLRLQGEAVVVNVDGVAVGRLAPEVAQEFCAAVVAGGLSDYTAFACDGRINADAQLWLDLPED
jgi:hypothetical protein